MHALLAVDENDLCTIPVSDLAQGQSLREKLSALKVISGAFYDNDCKLMFYCNQQYFTIRLSEEIYPPNSPNYATFSKMFNFPLEVYERVFSVRMWDTSGGLSLHFGYFVCRQDQPIPKDQLNNLTDAARASSYGKIKCSDCGLLVPMSNRRYFASTFCVTCWEGGTGTYENQGGWKTQEARETYN